MIPLTIPEIKRLLAALTARPLPRWLVIHWDAWTRRHQARSRWFCKRARLARDAENRPGQLAKSGCGTNQGSVLSGNVPGTVRAYVVVMREAQPGNRAGTGDDGGRGAPLRCGVISGRGGTGRLCGAACCRVGAALRHDAPERAGERRSEHRRGGALLGSGLRRRPPPTAQPDRLDPAHCPRWPASCSRRMPRPMRCSLTVWATACRLARSRCCWSIPGRRPACCWGLRSCCSPTGGSRRRAGARCCGPIWRWLRARGEHVCARGYRPCRAPCPRRLGRGSDGRFVGHLLLADLPGARRLLAVVRRCAGAELAALVRRAAPAAEVAAKRRRRPCRLPSHLSADSGALPASVSGPAGCRLSARARRGGASGQHGHGHHEVPAV